MAVRRDVLELMAEEISGRPVDALASFTSWDDGRRKLDGMAKGKRWDIDREQRSWERDNAADLARFVARHNWQKWMDAKPEKAKGAVQRWVLANLAHLRAYRAQWAKDHADKEREYDRRQMANTRADPVRLARYLAKQKRHRPRKNSRARERYRENLEEERARNRAKMARWHAKQPRDGKRKCSACGKPGHNRRSCSSQTTARE